ncbi:MAG: YaiI/YqxD family protein [Xanthomonadales bacterium]|nr:YaiI/YqxD family protein [Xanthomonadales bacterium]
MSAEAGPTSPSRIFVDADACPNVIKDILFRAADRARVMVTLIANQWVRVPASPYLRALQVAGGLDAADDAIAERCAAGDLVVTADIPLAARALEKGALALNPRGELYTADTIAQRLSMRNFMDELRGAGIATGGPPALHARDRQAFANALDRWLAQRAR